MFSPFILNQTFFFIIAYFLCHTSWFQKLALLFLWQIWLKQNSCFTDFNSFWYFCFHWNNDNIKNSLNQTAIFSSSNKCNFHIDQIKERLVKRQIKMLGIYGIGKKKKLNRTRTTWKDMIVFMIYDYYLI